MSARSENWEIVHKIGRLGVEIDLEDAGILRRAERTLHGWDELAQLQERRVAAVCARQGLHFYHQGDPRGCALYVSTAVLDGHNYTQGVAVCLD